MKNKKKVFSVLILCIAVLCVIVAVNRYTDVTSRNEETAYDEAVREELGAIKCVTYSYKEVFESANSSVSDDTMQEKINASFVLYDEYYFNGDAYVYEKVEPEERDRMEEELLSMYGMTAENLYLTSVECEDGYASHGDVRMYYNDRTDIYLTIFFWKYGIDNFEMEVYNVADGSSLEKLNIEEYGILNEPYAFVSREGTTGKEYVADFQEEKQYDEKGNLVSYHSYGTDINEFQYREGEQYNILDLLKIKYTYYDDGALKFVQIYNNQWVWGTYHSTCYYQYDKSGRCIFREGYLTHGGDEVFYLYKEDEKTPVYAVVFDGFFMGYDEMLRIYEYK